MPRKSEPERADTSVESEGTAASQDAVVPGTPAGRDELSIKQQEQMKAQQAGEGEQPVNKAKQSVDAPVLEEPGAHMTEEDTFAPPSPADVEASNQRVMARKAEAIQARQGS